MTGHMDAGSATYGAMPAGDATSDAEISRMVEAGELIRTPDDHPFRGPKEWHATGWDADREDG